MALVKGNTTSSASNGTAISVSHNSNTGTGLLLLVGIYHQNNSTVSNAAYNGVAMTSIASYTYSSVSGRVSFFYLLSPATGANNVTATLSNSNTWVGVAQSFTGASGIGNYANTDLSASPNSQTLTVSEGSLIYCGGTGQYQFDSTAAVSIGGVATSSANCDAKGVSYLSQVRGETSSSPLSAGSITCATKSVHAAFYVSNHRIEILGAATASRRIFLVT